MPAAPVPVPARSPRPRWKLAIAAALLLAGAARGAALVPGDILVTDSTGSTPSNSRLVQINPGNGATTVLSSAGFLLNPIGVAVDPIGRAFVNNVGSRLVVRIEPTAVLPAPVQAAVGALSNPRGIVLDPGGDAFITNPTTDEITRIDTVTGAGSAASASGLIQFPTGLVRDPNGDLVVADSGTGGSRILRINPQTGAQTQLAGAPPPPLPSNSLPFMVLRDIEIDPAADCSTPQACSFLVIDSGARKVFTVDATIAYDPLHPNTNVTEWAACPGFLSPRGIAVEAGGSVLVSDFTAKKVFRIQQSPVPRVCSELATRSALLGPWDVDVVGPLSPFVPGNLLVAGGTDNHVYRVNPGTNAITDAWPSLSFTVPVAVTRELNGNYLVLEDDVLEDRIVRVDSNGVKTTVSHFPEPVELVGIVVQADGEILVTDRENDQLVGVDPGTGVQTVVDDAEGTADQFLVNPAGLALDINGTVLVAIGGDTTTNPAIPGGVIRVNPFTGSAFVVSVDPLFGKPVGVALDSNGDYVIADEGKDTVWRFRASTPLNPILYPVSISSDITSLRGIAVDVNRSVLVTNQGAKEILRLDAVTGAPSEIAPAAVFADIRGLALDQVPSPPILDSDLDTILESQDNCRSVANTNQIDTNHDGYGNRCDADYDDSGGVNALDFGLLRNAYLTSAGAPAYDEDIDADSDGVIGSKDFSVLKNSFLEPPGPSGLACAGTIPCP